MRVAAQNPGALPRQLFSDKVSESRYFVVGLADAPAGWSLALGGRERCNADYVVDRRSYKFHVVEYVAEGEGTVSMDGRSEKLSAGSVFAYAPDTRLTIRTDAAKPMLKYFFCLAGRGARRRLADAGVEPGDCIGLSAHAEIRSAAEDIVREGQRSAASAARVSRLLFEVLLLKLSDQCAHAAGRGRVASQEKFLRVKSLIDGRAEHWMKLEDVADAAGMDVSTVCRLFRQFQGTSPYQYLLRKKMNLAAEYLVETGGQVKEAAQRVGFMDAYHFSRCFKSVHGVPPSRLLHRAPAHAGK